MTTQSGRLHDCLQDLFTAHEDKLTPEQQAQYHAVQALEGTPGDVAEVAQFLADTHEREGIPEGTRRRDAESIQESYHFVQHFIQFE